MSWQIKIENYQPVKIFRPAGYFLTSGRPEVVKGLNYFLFFEFNSNSLSSSTQGLVRRFMVLTDCNDCKFWFFSFSRKNWKLPTGENFSMISGLRYCVLLYHCALIKFCLRGARDLWMQIPLLRFIQFISEWFYCRTNCVPKKILQKFFGQNVQNLFSPYYGWLSVW